MSNRKGEPVVRTFTARDKELKVYYFTEMFGAKLDCAFLCVFSVDRDRMTLYLPNERKPPLAEMACLDYSGNWGACLCNLFDEHQIEVLPARMWRHDLRPDLDKEHFAAVFGLAVRALREMTFEDEEDEEDEEPEDDEGPEDDE